MTVLIAVGGLAVGLLAAVASTSGSASEVVSGGPADMYAVLPGIHKIKHMIIVMQENRSFDSDCGTYPGVDGIQMKTACRQCACPAPGAAAGAPIATKPT